MSLGVFMDCGAFGDQAYSLGRAHMACRKLEYNSYTVHTARDFFYNHGGNDIHYDVPPNPSVFHLWSQCSEVEAIKFSINNKCPGKTLAKASSQHTHFLGGDIPNDWLVDDIYFPDIINVKKHQVDYLQKGKIAVFQPMSLKFKPIAIRDRYVMHWEYSLQALIEKNYNIYMIGGDGDREMIERHVPDDYKKHIFDLVGKTTYLEALAMIMYQADFVLSCDSWAGLYGIGSRVPTCIGLGPKMWSGEKYLMNYLGNKAVYVAGPTEQAHATDKLFGKWIYDRAP